MRDLDQCEFNKIRREEMFQEIKPLTSLDYNHSHLHGAHAASCRAFVDWKGIAATQGRAKFAMASDAGAVSEGEMVLIEDDGSLTLESGELNYIAVWDIVRQKYGDNFDFVTFFSDFSMPFSYSFWSAIYMNTKGISPFQIPYNRRRDWSTKRLQGFHFINPAHLNLMGVYLQEFGHQWCSYTYYANSPDSDELLTDLLLDDEPGHWDHFMDDGHSPMNYDFQFTPHMSVHWVQREDDPTLFDYHAIEGIEYCDLDLYLMGLIPPEDVAPFYFIASPQQVGPRTWRGHRVDVTIEQVINAMGPRQIPNDTRVKDFRNAWVLVTRNIQSGRRLAATLNDTRREFESTYLSATRGLSSVDTRL